MSSPLGKRSISKSTRRPKAPPEKCRSMRFVKGAVVVQRSLPSAESPVKMPCYRSLPERRNLSIETHPGGICGSESAEEARSGAQFALIIGSSVSGGQREWSGPARGDNDPELWANG